MLNCIELLKMQLCKTTGWYRLKSQNENIVCCMYKILTRLHVKHSYTKCDGLDMIGSALVTSN